MKVTDGRHIEIKGQVDDEILPAEGIMIVVIIELYVSTFVIVVPQVDFADNPALICDGVAIDDLG